MDIALGLSGLRQRINNDLELNRVEVISPNRYDNILTFTISDIDPYLYASLCIGKHVSKIFGGLSKRETNIIDNKLIIIYTIL